LRSWRTAPTAANAALSVARMKMTMRRTRELP
jgi:hypothetical protein